MNRNKILLPVMILVILLIGGIYLFSQQQPVKPQLPTPKNTQKFQNPTQGQTDVALEKLKSAYPGFDITKDESGVYVVFDPKTKEIKKFKYENGVLNDVGTTK